MATFASTYRVGTLYEGIMQFAGCVQKVCNMRYWARETVRSAFYDDLSDYITSNLTPYSPVASQTPMPNAGVFSVDWTLTHNSRYFYLFGVLGNDKAKNVAITLLEFQKVSLPFIQFGCPRRYGSSGPKRTPIPDPQRRPAISGSRRFQGERGR